MEDKIKLFLEIVFALISTGLVIKLLKIVFRFIKNHIAIGKNIDNSYVASGSTVNKMIGDNNTMNVGTQTYYQNEEPSEQEIEAAQGKINWISDEQKP